MIPSPKSAKSYFTGSEGSSSRSACVMSAAIFQPGLAYLVSRRHRPTRMTCVSMGNPHAVQVVPGVDDAPVTKDGPVIENHSRFPRRVNAGFVQVVDRRRLRLRVGGRGAGETLACGTGACAAAVAGIRRGLLDSPVEVETRGGRLTIAWEGQGRTAPHPVRLRSAAGSARPARRALARRRGLDPHPPTRSRRRHPRDRSAARGRARPPRQR